MKQLSDPPKRIVVEMVGGSDRPEGPPSPKGLQPRGVKRAAGIGAERRGSTIFQRGDHERFEEETGSF